MIREVIVSTTETQKQHENIDDSEVNEFIIFL